MEVKILNTKRIRNLTVICALCVIMLTVSTYAWFVGMQKISVSNFEINVSSTESLFLSMDGKNWYYNLDAKNTSSYKNNTNTWADGDKKGLIPMSTVGDMDISSSRMVLFEKGSLSAVPGGYRLLASRVDNYSKYNVNGEYIEGDGYIAFDLFIKNLSGNKYYEDNDPANEEAIYLNTNSSVTVSNAGVENTGIENSVRVAFAQIGRVDLNTTNLETITSISCETNDQVTGICREASIWEPNDKNHVENAIKWYDTSCAKRIGANSNESTSYNLTQKCNTVQNDNYYNTYAISKEIGVSDYVNVYDGQDYNGYSNNTMTYQEYLDNDKDGKLVEFPYFTDTDKLKEGTERVEFMTLAPNSITKVRVYIYIEGQDIDNYDFAQLGKQISINFGFTKERFKGSEISNTIDDNITPNITATVA